MTETPSTGIRWRVAFVIMGVSAAVIAASVVAVAVLGGARQIHPQRLPPVVSSIETTTFNDVAPGIALLQRAAEELERFDWVDRQAGVITVPIEVAFDLYLEQRGRQP